MKDQHSTNQTARITALAFLLPILVATAFGTPSGDSAEQSAATGTVKLQTAESSQDYLGQPLPGTKAVVFAKGIVSDGHVHSQLAISPDGRELFWIAISEPGPQGTSRLMHVARTASGWTAPEPAPFAAEGLSSNPLFSQDGSKLFFSYTTDRAKGWQTRFVERTGQGWSEAKDSEPMLKPTSSFTKSGRVYYTDQLAGKPWNRGTYVAELDGSTYKNPRALPAPINSPFIDYTPFVAPDESALMFCSSRPSAGEAMFLHISLRNADGTWSEPIRMNSAMGFSGKARFPSLSPDGKLLFFCGDDGNLYWVQSSVIETLKKQIVATQRSERIHAALTAGDLNKVRALIEADPESLEAKDNDGNTPLHRACGSLKADIAKLLMDKGANVNARSSTGYTPLLRACSTQEQNFELVQALLSKGAEVNAHPERGITALHRVAASGNIAIAKLLIEHGADLNAYDKGGYGSVLQMAINSSPNEEMAVLLVASGAKPNQKLSGGNTELHLAALNGYANLARVMIEHGADIHARNDSRHTALYYAAKHGSRGVAEVLLAAGAKKDEIVETNYGKASQLTETLKDGEAYLWYLGGHYGGGYAVKTRGHLILIDKLQIDSSPEAGLANGRLNPNELSGLKITALVTKALGLVFEKQSFELVKQIPGVDLVIESRTATKGTRIPALPPHRLAAPNESFSVGDIQIHTIPAMGRGNGGAEGLGYLIEADGVKIFHAGFHTSSNKASQMEKYRAQIDFLKPFGPIDVAIIPVNAHVPASYEPYLYLLDQLSPKAVYLMGGEAAPQEYPKCAEVLKVRKIPVLYPESGQTLGERFHYLRDQASQKP